MWINNDWTPLVAVMTTLLCSVTTALDTDNKVSSNIVQILSKDSKTNGNNKHALVDQEKDLKTDATVTHNSEPAPEFYRGVSASDPMRDRTYEGTRYGTASDYSQKGSWLSLDKDSLYKNPYIANAYNKLTGGGGLATSTPSVSSLVSPNASYRDRYGKRGSDLIWCTIPNNLILPLDPYNNPSANDYLNNKYGSNSQYNSNYGSSQYGGYTSGGSGAPYGPAQALDYNHYGGSSSGYDSGYGNRHGYNHNSILSDGSFYGGGSSGYHHSNNNNYHKHGDFLSSKVKKT